MDKYYPPSKTSEMRKQITTFLQGDGESFSDAWERFFELLLACPHHGLDRALTIHFFHNGLNYSSKMLLHAVAGGSLMDKPYDEALAIIQGVTKNQRQWVGERGASFFKRVAEPGKYEVNNVDLILAKFDALNQSLIS